ncbi:hypothetical protein [Nocardia sp. CY41]|uniref:hypothetical protein n=1 Tax=Nocardia sp. CY41 TaxID=2608686 RepID=UPI0013586D91|nr:hypothetical protein [Nocardia sp. CY41]
MIKSWTDSHGVKNYADEHSKAYRDRDEAKPAERSEPEEAKPEEAKPKARTVTLKTDAQ